MQTVDATCFVGQPQFVGCQIDLPTAQMGHAFGLEQAGLAALQRRLYCDSLSDFGLQIDGARLHQVFQVGPVLRQLGQKSPSIS